MSKWKQFLKEHMFFENDQGNLIENMKNLAKTFTIVQDYIGPTREMYQLYQELTQIPWSKEPDLNRFLQIANKLYQPTIDDLELKIQNRPDSNTEKQILTSFQKDFPTYYKILQQQGNNQQGNNQQGNNQQGNNQQGNNQQGNNQQGNNQQGNNQQGNNQQGNNQQGNLTINQNEKNQKGYPRWYMNGKLANGWLNVPQNLSQYTWQKNSGNTKFYDGWEQDY